MLSRAQLKENGGKNMSIELEYALEHKNDPAVLCCRMEPGEISHHNLEDPAIFPDLVDTGLLSLDGCLTIGQCLGATEAAEEVAAVPAMAVPAGTQMTFGGGVVKLYIAEGKDISIEFPV